MLIFSEREGLQGWWAGLPSPLVGPTEVCGNLFPQTAFNLRDFGGVSGWDINA